MEAGIDITWMAIWAVQLKVALYLLWHQIWFEMREWNMLIFNYGSWHIITWTAIRAVQLKVALFLLWRQIWFEMREWNMLIFSYGSRHKYNVNDHVSCPASSWCIYIEPQNLKWNMLIFNHGSRHKYNVNGNSSCPA
jgi:hypothetical protein